MRLTLRTMLAYLDDVLDADDSAELGAKIEESEFASGLVQRIRNSMNRPQLDSPPLEGRGMGHDPNTVAEYLDNTLPAERMPDFERVCLESDSHLAEAASCHQVLTLVLGESAAVPSELRQRMYQMGAQVSGTASPPVQPPPVGDDLAAAQAAGAPAPASSALDAPMPGAGGRRNKPEVPDYIKTRSSLRLWPLALVLLLMLGLGGAAYMVFQGEDGLGSFFALGDSQENEESEGPDQKDIVDGETHDKGDGTAEEDTGLAAGGNADETSNDAPGEVDTGEPVGVVPQEPAADGDTGEAALPAEIPGETAGEQPAEGGADTPPVEHVADARPGDGTIPGVTEGVPGAEPSAPGAELGRYTSDRQVLLSFDESEGVWWRMASQTILAAGDTWLAPLAYRPQLTLASGLQLTLDGPTRITMLPPIAQDTPFLDVAYGKAVVVTIGRPNARLALRMGDREGELVFVDAASTCAIEVQRAMPFGVNPEQTDSILGSRIYCTRGSVTWIEAGGVSQALPAGSVVEMFGDSPAVLGEYLNQPAWVTGDHLNPSDQLGFPELEPLLGQDRPADLVLQERANDRRAEVRSLAARSLCYLGVYDPAIEALGDSAQRANWPGHVEALRHALLRGPAAAANVRSTLERKRPNDAAALYRMLWGYSQQDLEGGADAELVAALESESLDVRVMALENLREITGMYLLYRPEALEGKRRAAIASWQARLAEGEIRHPNVPVAAPVAPVDTSDAELLGPPMEDAAGEAPGEALEPDAPAAGPDSGVAG